MPTLNSSLSLTFVPTGDTNALTLTFPYRETYAAQAINTVDVPDETAADTEFEVSFGNVDSATYIFVRNKTGQELGYRINGVGADEYTIKPEDGSNGAPYQILLPGKDATTPVTAVTLVLLAEQAGAGTIETFVFGD